jgi:hypothetical protein
MEFYIQLVRGAMQLNRERNGAWKILEQLVDRLITHAVPKVLGQLEADGRVLKPVLIHGDLWDGNIGTDFETGEFTCSMPVFTMYIMRWRLLCGVQSSTKSSLRRFT